MPDANLVFQDSPLFLRNLLETEFLEAEMVRMRVEFDVIGAAVASTWETLSPELRESFEEDMEAALLEMANSQLC